MFTGIIKGVGAICDLQERDGDLRLTIDAGQADLGRVAIGDSIAVSGVCLTVLDWDRQRFTADVSRETLHVTTLGNLQIGSRVNLEAALRAGEPLGGHMVAGHVDGLGQLESKQADARSWRLVFSAPERLSGYIAAKGSIAIDGISLTVNEVQGAQFGVNIIPHTMTHTILGTLQTGQSVNVEIDIVARYLARMAGFD